MFRSLIVGSFAVAFGAVCPPGTKINVDGEKVGTESGVCNPVASDAKEIEFCGPGKLTYSRMTCNNHGYKATTVEHAKTEYTTQCETIPMDGTVTDGHLGSITVDCSA